MKFIITTSNGRDHVLPLFIKYFEHHVINADGFDIDQHEFELVGYNTPTVELPPWLNFVSLGHQRGPEYFTDDLHRYFRNQPDWFVWMMDDSIVLECNMFNLKRLTQVGYKSQYWCELVKFNLTNEAMRRDCRLSKPKFYVGKYAEYRLSTQPAIWRREWLLENMPILSSAGYSETPWQFEKKQGTPGLIVGWINGTFKVHEAIRKHDINTIIPIPEKYQLP